VALFDRLRHPSARLSTVLGGAAAFTLIVVVIAATGLAASDPVNHGGGSSRSSQGQRAGLIGFATTPNAPQREAAPAGRSGAFLYRQGLFGRGTFDRLRDAPGAVLTAHVGINNRGQITGTYIAADAVPNPDGLYDTGHGFVQDRRGNTVRFDVRDAAVTLPEGINDRGQIAGSYVDADIVPLPGGQAPPGSVHGFIRDRRGDIDTFEVPFWRLHNVSDINDRSQIVGYYDDPDFAGGGAFLRDHDGTITAINYPGALYTTAFGINDRGQIVGAYLAPGASPNPDGTLPRNAVHGFVWERGRFTTLDVPGSIYTQAYGINDHGQITGGYYDRSGQQHGFLRDGHRYRTLDVPGDGHNIAWGINDHGAVVLPDPRTAGLLPVATPAD